MDFIEVDPHEIEAFAELFGCADHLSETGRRGRVGIGRGERNPPPIEVEHDPAVRSGSVEMDLDELDPAPEDEELVVDGKIGPLADERLDQDPVRYLSVGPFVEPSTVGFTQPSLRLRFGDGVVLGIADDVDVAAPMPRLDGKRHRPGRLGGELRTLPEGRYDPVLADEVCDVILGLDLVDHPREARIVIEQFSPLDMIGKRARTRDVGEPAMPPDIG